MEAGANPNQEGGQAHHDAGAHEDMQAKQGLAFGGAGAGAGLRSRSRPSKTMEVVLVTDVVTGRQTIRMRVADGRSEKERQVGRNVCKETDCGEREAHGAEPAAGEQVQTALDPERKGTDQQSENRQGAIPLKKLLHFACLKEKILISKSA